MTHRTMTAAEYRTAQRKKMTEAQVCNEIIHALAAHGYKTPVQFAAINDAQRAKVAGIFMRVQQRDARRAGSDNGVPDLLVCKIAGWTLPWTYAFEIKRPDKTRAKVPPEQQVLADIGYSHIVTSASEVLAILGHTG